MINKLVWENLKHRPIRTSLSAVAIGIQVTMILTLVGLSRGMIEDSAERTRAVGADFMVRPPKSSVINLTGTPIPEGVLKVVRAIPHVAVATGVAIHNYGGLSNIQGIDMAEFSRMNGGFTFLSGGPFRGPDDIIVDEYFARQKKLHVGDSVDVANHNWRVCGVMQSGKLARALVQLNVLQDLIAATGKITMIYVKVDRRENFASVEEALKQKLEGYPVWSVEEFLSQISIDRIPMLKPFIQVIIGLSVVIGFLVVSLTMYTAVLERTREIGILKALGASSTLIARILIRETALLALIGSLLGIAFTFGTKAAIMNLFPASLIQKNTPDWWPITTAIAVVSAMLGTIYPGLKAARQDTVEALSYE